MSDKSSFSLHEREADRLQFLADLFAKLGLEPFAFFRRKADIVVILGRCAGDEHQQKGRLVADVREVAADRFRHANEIKGLEHGFMLAVVTPPDQEPAGQAEKMLGGMKVR